MDLVAELAGSQVPEQGCDGESDVAARGHRGRVGETGAVVGDLPEGGADLGPGVVEGGVDAALPADQQAEVDVEVGECPVQALQCRVQSGVQRPGVQEIQLAGGGGDEVGGDGQVSLDAGGEVGVGGAGADGEGAVGLDVPAGEGGLEPAGLDRVVVLAGEDLGPAAVKVG